MLIVKRIFFRDKYGRMFLGGGLVSKTDRKGSIPFVRDV